jgi:hypothetical protein
MSNPQKRKRNQDLVAEGRNSHASERRLRKQEAIFRYGEGKRGRKIGIKLTIALSKGFWDTNPPARKGG